MNGDGGIGEETLPAGAGGDMEPALSGGEGTTPAPVTPPQNTPQNAGQSPKSRVKISDILARMDLLEQRLSGKTPQAPVSSPLPESGPSGQVEEIGDDVGEDEADAGGVASGAPQAKAGTSGGVGLSESVTDTADALADIAESIAKPFRGMRLGNWNYGRKPK